MLQAEHGGLAGLRDPAMLDAALARPRQRAAYQPDSTLFELAAAYSYGLARNHPFVDGNKRIVLTLAAVFLELNGCSLEADEAETVVIYRQLAAGELDEPELARWIEQNVVGHR
jgi:death-on-curing protein